MPQWPKSPKFWDNLDIGVIFCPISDEDLLRKLPEIQKRQQEIESRLNIVQEKIETQSQIQENLRRTIEQIQMWQVDTFERIRTIEDRAGQARTHEEFELATQQMEKLALEMPPQQQRIQEVQRVVEEQKQGQRESKKWQKFLKKFGKNWKNSKNRKMAKFWKNVNPSSLIGEETRRQVAETQRRQQQLEEVVQLVQQKIQAQQGAQQIRKTIEQIQMWQVDTFERIRTIEDQASRARTQDEFEQATRQIEKVVQEMPQQAQRIQEVQKVVEEKKMGRRLPI